MLICHRLYRWKHDAVIQCILGGNVMYFFSSLLPLFKRRGSQARPRRLVAECKWVEAFVSARTMQAYLCQSWIDFPRALCFRVDRSAARRRTALVLSGSTLVRLRKDSEVISPWRQKKKKKTSIHLCLNTPRRLQKQPTQKKRRLEVWEYCCGCLWVIFHLCNLFYLSF